MNPLRIAIDASRTTVTRVTGTEHYAIALIRALIAHNDSGPQHQLTLYFRDTPAVDLFPASPYVEYKVIPLRRVWSHLRFAAALWQDKPHVTFVPAHTLPFAFPGKAVVTVHDLGYKLFPETHKIIQRFYLDLTTRFSAWRAAIILADSRATAEDLNRFYGTAAHKIRVVYPGVDQLQPGDLHEVRRKYELPEKYFLFIGTLQPRKNIARIVQAYALLRQATGRDTALVLAGGKGWLYDPRWVEGVAGIHLPGYIDEADKGAVYAGAIALVFPTLYEGFGFPVVEAMQCGTPVITSTTSSLPELAGEAGLAVDPGDIEAIAGAMAQIESDAALRDTLRARGLAQASQFTWQAAAAQTLDALESAANVRRNI